MKYTHLILDMDGTILDTLNVVEASFRKTAERWEVDVTPEHIDILLYSSRDVMEDLLEPRLKGGQCDFMDEVERRYKESHHLVKLFPGMADILELPVPLGIVTSENRDELIFNLELLKIPQSRFTGICCAGDTPYLKPHPYPLQSCMEQMGAKPEATLFVGDGVHDLGCAKATGVHFGLALWGARDANAFEGAEYIFSSLMEIIAKLDF